ncbi:radical SAM protein [Candidatus Saganbacteria bacterium CG08_land_8_20_14_0_20_45_16]|uniref:Radical SAM protein n=1 Tax=Candidatus Saganbacteria bacterium CG08_land_8_20_14_0_20_45_16 TaxID=2014293 RepID=A0A2H0Y180_UNCSA|nr:MAG: radical SAM protein [Candidatus Saganbacteria bacterium CG08_land_8_20_14_0_20_45_16]
MQAITYPIGDSLYLNITNRCTNKCSFCIRNKAKLFNCQHQLWLEKEPTAQEVIEAIGDPNKYDQIVFCGYGEPLIRLEAVKKIAKQLKTRFKIRNSKLEIRLDTNGQANLFWGRNIVPELKGLIDFISISLNTDNPNLYAKICQPHFGQSGYPAIIAFIKECQKYIPKVEVSIVGLSQIDKEACQKIAEQLGIGFRVRPYYEDKYVR